eukprot:scaffold236310_cov17-Tisochrysis_lutea.AAC.1
MDITSSSGPFHLVKPSRRASQTSKAQKHRKGWPVRAQGARARGTCTKDGLVVRSAVGNSILCT